MSQKMNELLADHRAWSAETFGPFHLKGPLGPLRHLEKEAREAQKEPYNLREKADILLLLIDAVHRSGATWDDLVDEAIDKMTENKDREWAKFDPEDPDKPLEHIR